ncbi:MAG TPA: hypothetical protein VG992_00075 [Candidatus Saccharimonadales bacterium]|nr:hypothetical protein [Candidatus Saccharimonadales bacterium]
MNKHAMRRLNLRADVLLVLVVVGLWLLAEVLVNHWYDVWFITGLALLEFYFVYLVVALTRSSGPVPVSESESEVETS